MEPKTLQVLLVDDDPNLLATMGDILKVKGFQPIPAKTGAAALACSGDIDVALIDLHLEDIPGLELLSRLKKRIPGIECILLTGHASQSSAIDAINAGAYSYFQKPCDIDQLVLSIQRAGEKRLADQALRASEAQYRLLASNISDVIWILDLQTSRFTYVSPSVLGLRGFTAEEVLAQELGAALTSASLEAIQKNVLTRLDAARNGHTGPYFDLVEQPRKDGTTVWTETTTHYHLNLENNHWEVYGVSRDITERRQAEEKLAGERSLLRTLIDNLPDRVYVKDVQGRKVISNISDWQASGGKAMEDILGKTDLETYPPEMAQEFWADDKKVLDTGTPIINREEPGRDSLGHTVSVLSSKLPLRDGLGKIIGLVGIGRDISERKQVEAALRESEERFRSLYENATVGMYRTTPDGRILMANPALLRMLSFDSFEQLAQHNLEQQDYEPDYPRARFLAAMEKEGQITGLESVWRRQDGGTIFVRESARLIRDAQGCGIYYDGLVEDITERKNAEKLQQAVSRIAQATDQAESLDSLYPSIHAIISEVMAAANFDIALLDKESGQIVFPYFASELGHPAPQAAGRGLTGYVLRTARSLLCDQTLFESLRQRGEIEQVGEIVPIWLGVPLLVAGEAIGVMVVQDHKNPHAYGEREQHILEFVSSQVAMAIHRKQTEEALIHAEQKYRSIFENATEGIHQTSYDGKIISVNLAGARMLGFSSPEELVANTSYLNSSMYVKPGRRAEFQRMIEKQGALSNMESEVYRKDGSTAWISENVHNVFDEQGNFLYYEGTSVDITRRKQAEAALHESEERFRVVFEKANDGIFITNAEDEILDVNPRVCEMLGYSRTELLKMRVPDLQAPEIRQPANVIKNELALHGNSPFEGLDLHRSGRRIPVEISVGRMEFLSGELYVAVVRDISERKQAEDALRESQRRMATLMGNLPGMVFRCKNDPDWTMEFISEGCYPLTGFQPDDLIGNARISYGQIIHPEDRQMVWDAIQTGLQNKKHYQLNYRIITAQAEVKWVWEQDQGVYDSGGKLIALEGFISDITERKMAEVALRESEERYRGAIAAAGLVPYEIDYKAHRFTYIGEDILKLTGYPSQEFTPDILKESVLESHVWGKEGTGITPEEATRRFTSGEIGNWRNDLRIRTRTGEERWVSDVSVPVLNEHGKVTAAIGIFQDLTERKLAEAELQASRAAEQAFAARLTILSETTTELSQADNMDDLCRHAVELGRERLDLDRLSIFFLMEDAATMKGTFGVDTEGRITDERGTSFPILSNSNIWSILRSETPLLRLTNEPLYLEGKVVGQGNHVYAGLWDGNTAIGFITVDNLLRLQPISDSDCEIIRLYASAVGHLCSLLRADAKLQASRAAEEAFAARLTFLSEATTELSKAEDIDALCRRTVELGRERLGFDRLSIWFLSKDRTTMQGSFGVDTEGRITDERSDSFLLGEDFPSWSAIMSQTPLLHRKDAPLALSGQQVGQGEHVTAGLWDGNTVTGYLSVDNLLRKEPFSERDCELIRLYATAVGHLISLKRVEREVRTSGERYRMLAENMSDTIWLMDLDLKITYISPSVTRQRGYTLEELNTVPLDQQMAPESFARFVKLVKTELAPERLAQLDLPISATLELEMVRKDGSVFWSANTFMLIRDSHGLPLTILGSGRDITESKKTWDALQNSEKRFRALIENNTDAIILVDPRGRVLYESPAYGRMTGRDTHERLGRSSFEFIHPEDRPAIVGMLNGLVQSPGRGAQSIFRNRHKDGSWRWVEGTATNLLGESAVQAVVINLHDITDQKQAEQTLQTTGRIYRQAITNAGGVPYQMDFSSDSYVFLGEGIQSLTGYLPDELTASLFVSRLRQIESFGEYKDLPHDERVRLARQEGTIQEWREDYLFARKDGSLVWLADHSVPVNDEAGKAIGSLGILMDVTERKQTEENIRRRVKELEVLYETGLYISSLLEPKEIGRKVIEVLSEKLSWSHASIRLYSSDTHSMELLVLNRPGLTAPQLAAETRRLNRLIAKPGQGFSGWVIQHGQPIRSGDVISDPRFIRTFKGIHSGLYVPMLVGQRTIGVIGAESERPDAFSEADERLLTTLAAQAGIAMENARLLAETLRQVEELGALADVSSALRTALARSEIIAVIFDQLMMSLFHAEDAGMVAYDPVTGGNVVEAARGKWSNLLGQRLGPGEGIAGVVTETRLPYQTEDITKDERNTLGKNLKQNEAVAGVPLLVQGQFIGSLWIGRPSKKKTIRPVPFSPNEMRLLGSVADMAANALQRASLHEQALKHADELLAVNNMGRSLAETLDLGQIYEKLDESVWQLLPDISLVGIALYDSEKKQLTYVRFTTKAGLVDVASLPPVPLDPPGHGKQSEPIHTRQPVIINNLRQQVDQLSFKMDSGSDDGHHTQSGLFVPMLAQGRVIGILQAQSDTLNRFSQADAGLMSLVANTAAADIQNARLFAETQKRLKNLAALHEIDVAISASVDIHVTLDILLEQTVSELNADAATVLLLNPLSRTLDYAASQGFHNHQLKGLRIPLGTGLAGQAALQRQIQSVSNLQDGLPLQDPQRTHLNIYDGESFMAHYAVPLNAKGQVQGVLEVFLRSPFQPDDDWFAFLETLSRQAAIAVDNNNLFENLQRSNTNIVLAYDATIQGWSQALELRDKETEGHARRVTERTVRLAQFVGIPAGELEHVRRGTLLHDIGKMGIPDAILLKPGKLTEAEWVIMRRHPILAYEMLSSIAYLRPALDIPHYHHEKWDGSGYPDGLKGEQIPMYARIFAIVDVYDALTNDRPYRPAWTSAQTIEYIRAESGKHFDPAIVEAFLNMLAREN